MGIQTIVVKDKTVYIVPKGETKLTGDLCLNYRPPRRGFVDIMHLPEDVAFCKHFKQYLDGWPLEFQCGVKCSGFERSVGILASDVNRIYGIELPQPENLAWRAISSDSQVSIVSTNGAYQRCDKHTKGNLIMVHVNNLEDRKELREVCYFVAKNLEQILSKTIPNI